MGTRACCHWGRMPVPSARVDSERLPGAHVILALRRRASRAFTTREHEAHDTRAAGCLPVRSRQTTSPDAPHRPPTARRSLCSRLVSQLPLRSLGTACCAVACVRFWLLILKSGAWQPARDGGGGGHCFENEVSSVLRFSCHPCGSLVSGSKRPPGAPRPAPRPKLSSRPVELSRRTDTLCRCTVQYGGLWPPGATKRLTCG